jgi:hypothetical protein
MIKKIIHKKCGLFYNALSINDYTVLNGRIGKQWIVKDLEGSGLWLNRGTILVFARKYWGKVRNISARISDVPANIRTEHLPNASLTARIQKMISYDMWHDARKPGIVKWEYTFVARQRLGKHIPAATNKQATIEQLPLLCNDAGNSPSQKQRDCVFCVVRAKWL